MDANPVIEMLGRPLRLAVIGGGPGSFIGAMHRTAARLDGRYELVAGVVSSDPERSRDAAAGHGHRPVARLHGRAWSCSIPRAGAMTAPRSWPS